jgi:hypothetical protein
VVSGLYNMVLGDGHEGERGALVLTLLAVPGDRRRAFVGRFRDAWFERQPDGPPIMVLYTRNGGHNRADQGEAITAMRAHPLYREDRDDVFDTTYATFYFDFPASRPTIIPAHQWPDVKEAVAAGAVDHIDTSKRWLDVIDRITRSSE